MNNKILIPILMILTCSFLISGMYAGESQTIPLNITNPIYTVTGNSSNLSGLNITHNGTHAEIKTAINYKPDNFTIIFLNQEKEIVHKHHHHGGGTNTVIEYKNKTQNITETIEVPYCNESCYNETQTNKTDDKDSEEKGRKIWKDMFYILAILAAILTLIKIIKNKKSAVGSNGYNDERGLEEDGNRKETEEKE